MKFAPDLFRSIFGRTNEKLDRERILKINVQPPQASSTIRPPSKPLHEPSGFNFNQIGSALCQITGI